MMLWVTKNHILDGIFVQSLGISSSFFFTGELLSGTLLYWPLDAKCPYLLPSSKPCRPWSASIRASWIVLRHLACNKTQFSNPTRFALWDPAWPGVNLEK